MGCEASLKSRERIPAGNTSTGILKLIALLFMICDHFGARLLPTVSGMRILGRLAFPIYCWCMIIGFHYTRSVPKYLFRILLVGLLVQPLYSVAMVHGWNSSVLSLVGEQISGLWAERTSFIQFIGAVIQIICSKPNIFLTLFMGLCALWGIRSKKWLSQIWAPALMLIGATWLNVDYGWKGILFIILLYAVQDSRPGIAAVMVSFFMYWGTFYGVTTSLFGMKIDLSVLPHPVSVLINPFMRLEAYGLLSLPLILIRFKSKWKMPTWLSYSLYPAHLVILLILEQFIH